MKHGMCILVVGMSMWVGMLGAVGDEELFLRGNKQYLEGNFEQATESYRMIKRKGQAVWYNLGNCAYRCGDYPNARICWLRAEQASPERWHASVAHNIAALDAAVGRSSTPSTWFDALTAVTCYVPLLVMQVLFLLFWCGLLGMVLTGGWNIRRGSFVTLCALSLVFGILIAVRYTTMWRIRAVTRENTAIFAGPDRHYHAVGTIDRAQEMVVHKDRGDWYKVKAGILVGWVPARDVVVV